MTSFIIPYNLEIGNTPKQNKSIVNLNSLKQKSPCPYHHSHAEVEMFNVNAGTPTPNFIYLGN